jgi:hypothetical protein
MYSKDSHLPGKSRRQTPNQGEEDPQGTGQSRKKAGRSNGKRAQETGKGTKKDPAVAKEEFA